MFCKQQVAEFRDYLPRIHAAGAELVILGNGTPQHAQWFIEDFDIQTPVFTDPEKKAYEAVGARRGWLSSMNPGTMLATLKAMKSGFRQSRTMGDAFQQGGVFVITPGGEMPYRYVSKFAGDHPPPEKPVAKAEELAPRG